MGNKRIRKIKLTGAQPDVLYTVQVIAIVILSKSFYKINII